MIFGFSSFFFSLYIHVFYFNLFSESWVIYRGKTGGISRLIYDAFRETSNTVSQTEPKNKNKETFNNSTLIAIRPAKKIEKVQILCFNDNYNIFIICSLQSPIQTETWVLSLICTEHV